MPSSGMQAFIQTEHSDLHKPTKQNQQHKKHIFFFLKRNIAQTGVTASACPHSEARGSKNFHLELGISLGLDGWNIMKHSRHRKSPPKFANTRG